MNDFKAEVKDKVEEALRSAGGHLSVWRVFAVVFLAMGVWYLVADIPGHAVMMVFALALEMAHDFTTEEV